MTKEELHQKIQSFETWFLYQTGYDVTFYYWIEPVKSDEYYVFVDKKMIPDISESRN